MKGTLEFNLRTENKEFFAACKATELALSFFDLDNYLRDRIKYHDEEFLEPVRSFVHETLLERGIVIDDLIQ